MKIHYLQHVPFENPGHILIWAEQHSHTITGTHLYLGEVPPSLDDFDWLIIMGGPMNIYEENLYPWLILEKRFLQTSIDAGKVVIGICLGAQLIADVIGGKVTRSPFKEIGWFHIELTDAALSNPMFSFFPKKHTVFQWHGDTFSTLPLEAESIASSEACMHQAFIYKKRVFGFQYHLENTYEGIQNLIRNCADEMVEGKYIQSADTILSCTECITQTNYQTETFFSVLEQHYKDGSLL